MAQIIISSPDDRELQLRKMQGRMWCEEEIIQHLSIYKQPRLPKSPPQLAKGLYIMLVPGNYQEKHRQNCGRPHLSKLGLQHHQWTQVGDKNMTQLTETVLGKEKKKLKQSFSDQIAVAITNYECYWESDQIQEDMFRWAERCGGVFHLWAVTNVSMNFKPSNLRANFSFSSEEGGSRFIFDSEDCSWVGQKR